MFDEHLYNKYNVKSFAESSFLGENRQGGNFFSFMNNIGGLSSPAASGNSGGLVPMPTTGMSSYSIPPLGDNAGFARGFIDATSPKLVAAQLGSFSEAALHDIFTPPQSGSFIDGVFSERDVIQLGGFTQAGTPDIVTPSQSDSFVETVSPEIIAPQLDNFIAAVLDETATSPEPVSQYVIDSRNKIQALIDEKLRSHPITLAKTAKQNRAKIDRQNGLGLNTDEAYARVINQDKIFPQNNIVANELLKIASHDIFFGQVDIRGLAEIIRHNKGDLFPVKDIILWTVENRPDIINRPNGPFQKIFLTSFNADYQITQIPDVIYELRASQIMMEKGFVILEIGRDVPTFQTDSYPKLLGTSPLDGNTRDIDCDVVIKGTRGYIKFNVEVKNGKYLSSNYEKQNPKWIKSMNDLATIARHEGSVPAFFINEDLAPEVIKAVEDLGFYIFDPKRPETFDVNRIESKIRKMPVVTLPEILEPITSFQQFRELISKFSRDPFKGSDVYSAQDPYSHLHDPGEIASDMHEKIHEEESEVLSASMETKKAPIFTSAGANALVALTNAGPTWSIPVYVEIFDLLNIIGSYGTGGFGGQVVSSVDVSQFETLTPLQKLTGTVQTILLIAQDFSGDQSYDAQLSKLGVYSSAGALYSADGFLINAKLNFYGVIQFGYAYGPNGFSAQFITPLQWIKTMAAGNAFARLCVVAQIAQAAYLISDHAIGMRESSSWGLDGYEWRTRTNANSRSSFKIKEESDLPLWYGTPERDYALEHIRFISGSSDWVARPFFHVDGFYVPFWFYPKNDCSKELIVTSLQKQIKDFIIHDTIALPCKYDTMERHTMRDHKVFWYMKHISKKTPKQNALQIPVRIDAVLEGGLKDRFSHLEQMLNKPSLDYAAMSTHELLDIFFKAKIIHDAKIDNFKLMLKSLNKYVEKLQKELEDLRTQSFASWIAGNSVQKAETLDTYIESIFSNLAKAGLKAEEAAVPCVLALQALEGKNWAIKGMLERNSASFLAMEKQLENLKVQDKLSELNSKRLKALKETLHDPSLTLKEYKGLPLLENLCARYQIPWSLIKYSYGTSFQHQLHNELMEMFLDIQQKRSAAEMSPDGLDPLTHSRMSVMAHLLHQVCLDKNEGAISDVMCLMNVLHLIHSFIDKNQLADDEISRVVELLSTLIEKNPHEVARRDAASIMDFIKNLNTPKYKALTRIAMDGSNLPEMKIIAEEIDERVTKNIPALKEIPQSTEALACDGCTFENQQLSSRDLSNITLNNSTFDNSSFKQSLLVNGTITDSSLKDCSFSGAIMQGTKFKATDLSGSDFTTSTFGIPTFFDNAEISNSNITEVDFSGAKIKNTTFKSSRATASKFNDSNLVNVSFEDVDCRNCIFDGAHIKNVTFSRCDMTGSLWRNCTLDEFSIPNSIFDEADFNGTPFARALKVMMKNAKSYMNLKHNGYVYGH